MKYILSIVCASLLIGCLSTENFNPITERRPSTGEAVVQTSSVSSNTSSQTILVPDEDWYDWDWSDVNPEKEWEQEGSWY